MNTLITRQIDPRINIINKVLLFSTPILLFSNHSNAFFLYAFFICGLSFIGVYELYVYKKNEAFIQLLEKDKFKFSYILMMKYYKVLLLILLFSLPWVFMKNGTIFFMLCLLTAYVFLVEFFILQTNILKLILKYLAVTFIFIFIASKSNYINAYNIRGLFNIIMIFQFLYLFINFNIIYAFRNKLNSLTYLNKDLIISIFLIFIYELLVTNILFDFWAYNPTSFIILYFTSLIIYGVFLFLLLTLNRSLKKKFHTKSTKYTKIVNLYFIIIIFLVPIIHVISSIHNIKTSVLLLFLLYFTYCLIIILINIILIICYKSTKGIFKKDIIKEASDIL